MTNPSFKQKLQALVEASNMLRPLKVVYHDRWPFEIEVVDAEGSRLMVEGRIASSSRQNSLEDVRAATGFKHSDVEQIRKLITMQEARLESFVELSNAAPAILELLEAAEAIDPRRIGHGPSTDMSMLHDAQVRIRKALSALEASNG